jgi:lipopolysaccharide biosynthesis glycosyltransferase
MGIPKNDSALMRKSFEHPKVKKLEFLDLFPEELSLMRPTMYMKSRSSYSRLFIDKKLPKDISRCLWLDTDLIINSDISALYDISLGEDIVGAVKDVSAQHLNEDLIRHFLHDLKLDDPHHYFNAGVLLIDLKKWRENNIGEKAIHYARTHYHVLNAQDQDVLNAILKGKWKSLEERWNQSQYNSSLNEKEGIIHLIGQRKPWHADYDYRFKERFLEILDSTPFKGRRPLSFGGLGKHLKWLERKIPTSEIIYGKIYRILTGFKKK